MDCQNVVDSPFYDLYKLSNDPSPPSPPPQAFELVHDGGECGSSDAGFPSSHSVEECAAHCAAANGCEFFSYNAGNRYCFHEFTTSRDCPEGFEVDDYDFYALVPAGHDHGRTLEDSDAARSVFESFLLRHPNAAEDLVWQMQKALSEDDQGFRQPTFA